MSKLNLLASSSSISQFPAVLSVLIFQVPIFNPQWLSGTFRVLGWQFVFGLRNVTFRLLTLLELCLGVFSAAPQLALSSSASGLVPVELATNHPADSLHPCHPVASEQPPGLGAVSGY